MLEIDKRYIRTAPDKEQTVVIIKNEAELKYHNDLLRSGFKYSEVKQVEARGSVCISCEG